VTRDDVLTLWLVAREIWDRFDIPESADLRRVKEQVWLDVLGDLDGELVRAALVDLSAREFPPAVGTIREAALRLSAAEASGSRIPDPDEAWAEVSAAVRAVGRYRAPEFSHPAVGAAVELIGWTTICDSQDDGSDRFVATYRAVLRRAARAIPPPILAARVPALAKSQVGELDSGGGFR
jgi:hypothetical protein